MGRLTFKINGIDFSPHISRYGYAFGYEKRYGNNGGIMLDGSETVDVLNYKAVIAVDCNAMKSETQALLISTCTSDYVTITYFDPHENADRTATFIPEIGQMVPAILRAQEKWFTGLTISFREK